MGKLTRFGISLDENLLEKFDSLLQEKGYSNRSEGIRDLIRASLLQSSWTESGIGGGTLTLVYDHHKHDLSRRLMNIQHEENDIIITSVHVHLDHHNCLEVLILKGDCKRIENLAQKLATCRGVVYGKFIRVPTIGELV